MNWDAVGAIAESLGAIAVVATLVALMAQLRQFSRSLTSSAELDAANRLAMLIDQLADDESMAATWVEIGLGDPQSGISDTREGSLGQPISRSDPSYGRLIWKFAAAFQHADAIYTQYRRDSLTKTLGRCGRKCCVDGFVPKFSTIGGGMVLLTCRSRSSRPSVPGLMQSHSGRLMASLAMTF